jgi:hypothetical protein
MEMDVPVPPRPRSAKPAGKEKEAPALTMLQVIETQAATLASELNAVQAQLQQRAEECSDLEQQVC